VINISQTPHWNDRVNACTIQSITDIRKAASSMAVIAFLTFTLVILPILAVTAGADTWQRNQHNWT
jgi:hypothetical protein